MDSVIHAACMYVFLMLVIRLSGPRTLKEMTTFDFVLLLIVGDASQQALTGTDYSFTNGVLIILTLIALKLLMSFLKQKFRLFEKIVDGTPLILINNGRLEKKLMEKAKIDTFEILQASRENHGLERLDEIKYAILEKNGDITIIPFKHA